MKRKTLCRVVGDLIASLFKISHLKVQISIPLPRVIMLGIWTLFTVWVGSVYVVLATLLALVFLPLTRPYVLAFAVAYYGSRLVMPLRRSQYVCEWFVWANSPAYFAKQEVVREDTEPVAKQSKTMFAFHPHGVLCCGWSVNGAMNASWLDLKISWLAADVLFKLPFVSHVLSWGGSDTAAKPNFERLMKQGDNIALLPGGFEEATLFAKGEHRVYIKKRAGFIKYGLQCGYTVYPVYTFGEEETFYAVSWFLPLRLWLNRFQVPGVIPFGTWWCSYMPLRSAKLTTVVGKPIKLPRIDAPTREDVAKYHQVYMDALQGVFDRNKAKYATDPEATLHMY
ncbi:Aste57867_13105 [Aphanomyces stellatus]|uniref:Acyltransferase n=1 Tax=Aphanomyces stellatus TaxID=120398 RepID=A0A485KXR2_9STRA|nr:hypothetical protein As57867_013057 [Aphanomyces stellatus]VFT89949.1 Aste57867_13105 [Aphanomyces stellatus]